MVEAGKDAGLRKALIFTKEIHLILFKKKKSALLNCGSFCRFSQLILSKIKVITGVPLPFQEFQSH